MEVLSKWVEDAWNDRSLLQDEKTREFVTSVIDLLDQGKSARDVGVYHPHHGIEVLV